MSPHAYIAGFTHASNVNAVVMALESRAGTCTSSLAPANWTPLPYMPAPQPAPCFSRPLLPLPDTSAATPPAPSLNASDTRGAVDAAAVRNVQTTSAPSAEPAASVTPPLPATTVQVIGQQHQRAVRRQRRRPCRRVVADSRRDGGIRRVGQLERARRHGGRIDRGAERRGHRRRGDSGRLIHGRHDAHLERLERVDGRGPVEREFGHAQGAAVNALFVDAALEFGADFHRLRGRDEISVRASSANFDRVEIDAYLRPVVRDRDMGRIVFSRSAGTV